MGPLRGVKIIELAGIGPCPMCAMLLAELGADVVRVDRPADSGLGIGMAPEHRLLHRSRPSIAVDLKHPDGVETVLRLVDGADALIEGFRPGVTERLGIGPEDCAARNPGLVYGRVTGWGQDGPLAGAAGHDLDYIALTGALDAIGRRGAPPTPPLNLVGDFGGGALYLALGVVAALYEARESGRGQTVDAAMIDGAASLMTSAYALRAAGVGDGPRGENVLDGGAHFYEVYETSDGRYVAIAPVEPKFYAELLERIGLDPGDAPHSMDRADWPASKAQLAARFRTRTATSGARSSKARTPASLRCSGWTRRTATRTTPPARRSSSATASCSRTRRRASTARRAASAAPRRPPRAGPGRCWPIGASPRPRSTTSPPAGSSRPGTRAAIDTTQAFVAFSHSTCGVIGCGHAGDGRCSSRRAPGPPLHRRQGVVVNECTGGSTPARAPSRHTAPFHASSSDGLPSMTSRCSEAVRRHASPRSRATGCGRLYAFSRHAAASRAWTAPSSSSSAASACA